MRRGGGRGGRGKEVGGEGEWALGGGERGRVGVEDVRWGDG